MSVEYFSMDRLSIKECELFVKNFLPQMLNVGLIQPLREFADRNRGDLSKAIKSWYKRMKEGKAIQDSIQEMYPRFPQSIEKLFLLGAEQSILDHVLADMIKIYDENDSEEALLTDMSLLVDRYQNEPSSDFICQGCFERDFDRIIQRATVENASEVIFEQEGERFFHQKYIGVKIIHIIEPCHSKTYKTILHKLREYAESGLSFVVSNNNYNCERIDEKQFKLTGSKNPLILSFK